MANQKWRPDVKTATYIECINDICILAGYRQFQTNNRASREICIQIFNKKKINTITLNHVWFLDKFQIATLDSKGIAIR